MLQITREDDWIRISADSPQKVRLKCKGGHFLPDRAGKMVGGAHGTWAIRIPLDLEARAQRFADQTWTDEGG